MKNKIFYLLFFLMVYGCTPVQYVYVDQKDSVIRKQRIIYDDYYDLHMPLYFNYYSRPFYNPIIIRTPQVRVQPNRPPRGKR